MTGGQIIPYGPTLAAVFVLAFAEGRRGLAELWRKVTKWRVRWYWYLVAPELVIAYQLAAHVSNQLLGAGPVSTAHLFPPAAFLPLLLELVLVGGWWEEPGWSGFALPRLLDRFSNRRNGFLIASLVLGVFRGIWHLPLLAFGHIPWYDVVFLSLAFQLIITWLYLSTGGSVLIVMLFHFASNVIGGGMFNPLYSGEDFTRYYQLFIAFACVTAIVLMLSSWRKFGREASLTASGSQGASTKDMLVS